MRIAIASVFFVSLSSYALAGATQVALVGRIETGWESDRFVVFLDSGPIANPFNCPKVDNGYVADISFPGYRTFYTAVLTAYAAQRRLSIAVSNNDCFIDRPRIIGVTIYP
jgi:hypothetical protein